MKKLIIAVLGISLFLFGCTQQTPKDERCYQIGRPVPEVKPGQATCMGMFLSYQYETEQKKCMAFGMSGCGVKSPFKSLKECQEVCEK
jgi:hypothetical protein